VQATSDQAYQQYSAVPAEVMSQQDDAVSVLYAYGLFGPVQDAAQQAVIAGYNFYQALVAALPKHSGALVGRSNGPNGPNPDTIITVYCVKDDDTPQKISQRFYGVPDHAADIMRANHLSWHTTQLPTGKQLVIPVLSSSTQSV
jgi:nucleoid-associated protein YgaU